MQTQEQEFLSLIEQHKGIIYKVSRMYMDDPEDVKDLSQEIILQLWKSYASFKAQSTFSTWMYRVGLNVAITFLKKSSKKIERSGFVQKMEVEDVNTSEQKENQLTYFYKAVHELSQIEKALIFLFLEGQSHKEIAYNLGISEGNARVKLNRTKEKLQQIIKRNGYEF